MDIDVIVIGAGAAGLAAARSLATHSLRVLIVEARDRAGGRVHSVPSVRRETPVELGAEFIHGPAEATMALLRETGSRAIETDGESWTAGSGGSLRRADEDFVAAAAILESALGRSDDESVDRFLHRAEQNGTTLQTSELARLFVEGFDAADPAIASAQAIADELQSGVDFVTRRPLGGYAPLIQHLHDACLAAGVRMLFSTVVNTIRSRRGAVTIDVTNSAGAAETIRARCAIVTLPIGVLRNHGDRSSVVFDPAFPEKKRQALSHIEMGQVVKATLLFKIGFLERIADGRYRGARFFRSLGQPFPAYWTHPLHPELIVAWAGGPRATAMRAALPEEIVDRAVDGLGAILGEPAGVRAEFQEGFVHDWGSDPFAQGAYSYVAVGGRHARAALAEPLDGTLFFAGEATSTDGQGGTVNGALETGQRAAREAAACLGVR